MSFDVSVQSSLPTTSTTKRRILVADDNRDAADCLGLMLRALGQDVATAYDGQQALERAEEFEPEVVLLDLGMPRGNGYDVAQAIRKRTWGENAVLVAVTGWDQDEDRLRTREAGFDLHLVKPILIDQLMQLIS